MHGMRDRTKLPLQSSLNIARLVGPALAILGIGLLTNGAAYREMANQLVNGYPFIYFSGVLLLIGGLSILNTHNFWTSDWRSIITALGWVMTTVGAFRLIAPPFVTFIGSSLFATRGFFLGAGVVFLALGALLTYKGYVAEFAASETDP